MSRTILTFVNFEILTLQYDLVINTHSATFTKRIDRIPSALPAPPFPCSDPASLTMNVTHWNPPSAPNASLSRKRSSPSFGRDLSGVAPPPLPPPVRPSSAHTDTMPIAEVEDEYGFYCDENGDSNDSPALPPFATVAHSPPRFGRRDSFGFATSSVDSGFVVEDPISHIHKAVSPRFQPASSSSSSSAVNDGFSLDNHNASDSFKDLNMSNNHALMMADEDAPMEAPVWVVNQGPSKPCEWCSRRIVYTARDNTPGRVFSRSFHSMNSSLSSSFSRTSFDSSSGGSGGSGQLDGVSASRLSLASRGSGGHEEASLQSLSSYETFETPTAAALGGFRVVAGWFPGQEWAEFEIVVSTGSTVYRSWRTHADFARLVETVGVARKHRTMSKANFAWQMVTRCNKWIGGCEMLHLIKKRQCLDLFVENLLYELDSPVQFLNFVDDSTWGGSPASCPCNSQSCGSDDGSARKQPQDIPVNPMVEV